MCEQSSCKCTPPPKKDYTSIDYQLSILTAAKEGKEIEFSQRNYDGPYGAWKLCHRTDGRYNFSDFCFRVKREPRTFTIWSRPGDNTVVELKSATPADRQRWLNQGWKSCIAVEVLDA